MKKIQSFAILLAMLAAALCGCGKNSKNFTVTLKSNPVSGFVWDCKIEDESIVAIAGHNMENTEESLQKTTGNAVNESYILKGVSAGTVSVIFECRSLINGKVVKTEIYELTVDEDLKVTGRALTDTEPAGKTFETGLLEINASTGYRWEYETSGDGGIKELGKGTVDDGKDDDMLGKPSRIYYIFGGVKPGKVTLTFTKVKPSGEATDEKVEYYLTVDENLNVSEITD